MRGLSPAVGRPWIALPVGETGRRSIGQTLPPHITVWRFGDVGKNHILFEHRETVRVRLGRSARRNPEEPRLGIDRIEATILARLDPGDVLAHGRDLPAFEGHRRHHHCEVRLPAGRREGSRDIVLPALGGRDPQDQHVFGEPPLLLPHDRSDPQREALFAKQRIATVAGAKGPDLLGLRKVDDVLVFFVARPTRVLLTRGQRRTDRMNRRHEVAVGTEDVPHLLRHARHDSHVYNDVRRIGDLHAAVRDVRAQRPHRERHDVHRAAAHATVEQALQRLAHLLRIDPVVRRTSVFLGLGADEGPVLHARHVTRV